MILDLVEGRMYRSGAARRLSSLAAAEHRASRCVPGIEDRGLPSFYNIMEIKGASVVLEYKQILAANRRLSHY